MHVSTNSCSRCAPRRYSTISRPRPLQNLFYSMQRLYMFFPGTSLFAVIMLDSFKLRLERQSLIIIDLVILLWIPFSIYVTLCLLRRYAQPQADFTSSGTSALATPLDSQAQTQTAGGGVLGLVASVFAHTWLMLSRLLSAIFDFATFESENNPGAIPLFFGFCHIYVMLPLSFFTIFIFGICLPMRRNTPWRHIMEFYQLLKLLVQQAGIMLQWINALFEGRVTIRSREEIV
ncbi:uncharacterized protein C8R40DRAFT_1232995 [Lentinula edodes]|uniref:uncharacterized protein n=1 Tax=Lentinula edodes TaxID=5353 RepID=UPI001E8DCB6D|nr:uncharacterized protein C8R40DRAFT_1232995 [Lentinula edodes]KAH7880932.1 hypothetical protein C8R40DRAFT_1232995 [Lentinula edodes]